MKEQIIIARQLLREGKVIETYDKLGEVLRWMEERGWKG